MKHSISIFLAAAFLLKGCGNPTKQIVENNDSIITNYSKNLKMENKNFTTTLLVDQTPKEVFDAITNPRGWWSEGIKGETEKLDDEFIFEVEDVHYSKQKLVELIPDKQVVWLVIESELSFIKDKNEWTGTKVIFDISKKGNKTQLVFTHEGLVPEVECYRACSPAWTEYIQHSLFNLITTGKGDPNLEGRSIEKIK